MHQMTLAEIARGLAEKKFSSEELTRVLLSRIATLDPQLNSFISLTEDLAITQAQAADARRAAGENGPLLGAPLAHKDLFCTQGIRTSCGSRMLDNFKAPYDATVVSKLASAGTVTLGKTNMDEFAMGSANESSHYGVVKNPWNLQCVPGGSSGGSAAAVAARLLPAATGTDTGGSIRQPAALTNLTGLKPTYGRVSRWGMIAYASSLDQAGPMARTAEDCALLLQGMAGFDPQDSTSIDEPVPDYSASLNTSLKGLRIGVPKEYFSAGLDPRIAQLVHESVKELEKLGAVVKEVSLPNLQHAIPAYYVIAPAEASSNLSRFDGVRFGYRCEDPKDLTDLYKRSRAEGFGPEVQRRIMVGAYALSAGGPIMHPKLDAIVIVPMYPHTLSGRPIVVDGNSELKIVVSKDMTIYPQVSCDGQNHFTCAPGDTITVSKKPQKLRLIHPLDHNYYEVCRTKLGWGSKLGGGGD
ncbi:Glutamyl-tRNA amidotransferase subunit A [Pseudomonas syringae pv. broussonetiae]|nr:Glutamyl-tRNA amidotransferase subunit A [Pseudomonas syringae pv. broussonetiae]